MNDNLIFYIIICGFLFYFLLIQSRRYRWRSMAQRLGAKYFSTGLIKTGRISGMSGGRKYFIATNVRSSGVIIPFVYEGIPLGLATKFFTSFPDWRYAFTIGENSQKRFVADVTFKDALIQLPSLYQAQVIEAFQALRMFYPHEEHRIGDGYLWLSSEGAEFKCKRLIFDSERIEAITSLLLAAVELMEKHPVKTITESGTPHDCITPLDP